VPVLLVALDSVGIDPLGHDRAASVYAGSTFLFPRGRAGALLDLPDAPVEGALVETDVTGGERRGSIECAITYTTLFTGTDALKEHGLVQGLGLREQVLERLLSGDTLFHRFAGRACLANALFPAHLPFLRGSYVQDLLPAFDRDAVEARVTLRGEPVRLTGPDKHGLAELFTIAELNQNPFVLAARRAGVRLRTWADVRAGEALTSTLTHALERALDLSIFDATPLPARTPEEGAAVLARLAASHAFTFYKYQTADLVAHTHRVDLARETFAEIERFLGALLAELPLGTRTIVTSDHGHLEQVGFTRGHPKSNVPTWVFGPDARRVADGLREPAAIHRHIAALA
jgi:hypothetical protein